MLAIPLIRAIETSLEASSPFSPGYRTDLLLNQPVDRPALDRLVKLDHLVIADYPVRQNEDLPSIANRYHLKEIDYEYYKEFSSTVRSSNDLEENLATAGTILKIPNHKGTLYTVKSPESLHVITPGYDAGRKGGHSYELKVLALNHFPLPNLRVDQYPFLPDTVLFLPNAFKPTGLLAPFTEGTKIRYTSSYGSRRHPISGVRRAHKGVDLALPYGHPVTLSRAGTVTFAGWMGGYGNMIEIRHTLRNGRIQYTRYGHLSKILVHEGQRVHLYQKIGNVGSTGNSTGPHLHYEIRNESGTASRPDKYM
ncbi:MAG: M23 family metallopeptidase [Elusimicrobiota bacterium]